MATVIRTSEELRRYAAATATGSVGASEFRSHLTDSIKRVPVGLIRRHAFVSCPDGVEPVDTGIDLSSGESVTIVSTAWENAPTTEVADTDTALMQRSLVEIELARGVWRRVGTDGVAQRGAGSSETFIAQLPGRLFLSSTAMPNLTTPPATGEWRAERRLTSIDRCALVVVWAADPLEGLNALHAGGDVAGLIGAELERLQTEIELPEGWYYPTGSTGSEQFAAAPERPTICCYSRASGALLLKDASLAFVPGTMLRWAQKTQRLPSSRREDSFATHDYLSVAVEFDNGRDLTYYWSSELPVGTAYHCPVPGWYDRETHIVIRSGTIGLGEWFEEERDLYADYERHVGTPPAEIVRVWLLAMTLRQGGEAQCEYGRIELENSVARVRVN
jgi:hypothetical protein